MPSGSAPARGGSGGRAAAELEVPQRSQAQREQTALSNGLGCGSVRATEWDGWSALARSAGPSPVSHRPFGPRSSAIRVPRPSRTASPTGTTSTGGSRNPARASRAKICSRSDEAHRVLRCRAAPSRRPGLGAGNPHARRSGRRHREAAPRATTPSPASARLAGSGTIVQVPGCVPRAELSQKLTLVWHASS